MRENAEPTPRVLAWKEVRRRNTPGLSPEAFAELIFAEFLPFVAPVDVEALASRLGVSLTEVDSVSWAGAVNTTDRSAAIWVRRSDPTVRKRFTIGHELGHLTLHEAGAAFRDDTFTGDWREVQANRFAAALLMPEPLVSHLRRRGLTIAKELARILVVSESAMKYRLANLTGEDPERIR